MFAEGLDGFMDSSKREDGRSYWLCSTHYTKLCARRDAAQQFMAEEEEEEESGSEEEAAPVAAAVGPPQLRSWVTGLEEDLAKVCKAIKDSDAEFLSTTEVEALANGAVPYFMESLRTVLHRGARKVMKARRSCAIFVQVSCFLRCARLFFHAAAAHVLSARCVLEEPEVFQAAKDTCQLYENARAERRWSQPPCEVWYHCHGQNVVEEAP